MDADLARRVWRNLEPIHAMIYFAPEAEAEFTGLGLEAGRMSYFAGRAAPMGPVGPGVVTATFYNFNPALVARHIPAAWSIATPEALVAARLRAADAALRRLLGERVGAPEVGEAADLARRIAEHAAPEGRPLFAGHADLDWPDEPHLRLWHACSLVREFRGDGHIVALAAAGLTGLQALITHTASGKGFIPSFAMSSRGWSDEDWARGTEGLRERGLLDSEGALTAAGEQLRQQLETDTDRMALAPFGALRDEEATRLVELAKGLGGAVLAGIPAEIFAGR